jgi:hypothetical protein
LDLADVKVWFVNGPRPDEDSDEEEDTDHEEEAASDAGPVSTSGSSAHKRKRTEGQGFPTGDPGTDPATPAMIAMAYRDCNFKDQARTRAIIRRGSRATQDQLFTMDDLPKLSATDWKKFIGSVFRAARLRTDVPYPEGPENADDSPEAAAVPGE